MSRCDHKPLNLLGKSHTFHVLHCFVVDVLIVSFHAKNCPELIIGLDLVGFAKLHPHAVTLKPLPEEERVCGRVGVHDRFFVFSFGFESFGFESVLRTHAVALALLLESERAFGVS